MGRCGEGLQWGGEEGSEERYVEPLCQTQDHRGHTIRNLQTL